MSSSSDEPKIPIAISIDPNRFNKSIDSIKQKLKTFVKESKTADKALSKLGESSSKTAPKIAKVGTSAQSATGKLSSMGNAAKKTSSSVKSSGAAASSAATDMTTLATSVLGLAQGFTGLSDAVFGFNEKAVALERSRLGLEDLTIQLRRAEEDLVSAYDAGEISQKELLRQEEDLIQLRKMHAVEIKTVQAESEALNGEYVTFAVNIAAVSAQSVIAIKALNLSAGATGALSSATKLLRIDLHGASLALRGFAVSQTAIGTTSAIAATGIHRVSLALKGMYMALGPIGWAVIGVTAAWTAWETNLLGFRDGVKWVLLELQKLYDTIKWLIPIVGLVDEAFKAVAPEQYAAGAKSVTDAIHGIGVEATDNTVPAITSLNSELDLANTYTQNFTTSSASLGKSLLNLKDPTMELASSMAEFYHILYSDSALDDINKQIETISIGLQYTKDNFDLTSFSGKKALYSLRDDAAKVVDEFVKLEEPDMAYAFIDNLRDMDVYGSKYLDSLTNKVKSLNKELNESKKNYDNILNSKPTGTAESAHLELLRVVIQFKLQQDLQNLSNRAGVITSLANQELNFKFITIRNKIQSELRFAQLQSRSFVENMVDRTKIMIQSHMAKTMNNFASANYVTGGNAVSNIPSPRTGRPSRSSGYGGVGKYYRQRFDAETFMNKAAAQYESFFGAGTAAKVGYLPRRGVTSTLLRHGQSMLDAVKSARDQLSRFAVGPDYTARTFRDLITPGRRSGSRLVGGQLKYKYQSAVYGDVFRTPTQAEAMSAAVAESARREKIYGKVLSADSDLLSLEKQHGPISDILKWNNQNNQQEKETLDRLAYLKRTEAELLTSTTV